MHARIAARTRVSRVLDQVGSKSGSFPAWVHASGMTGERSGASRMRVWDAASAAPLQAPDRCHGPARDHPTAGKLISRETAAHASRTS